MASFRDPAQLFEPLEVIERLIEISELFGGRSAIHASSSLDLAIYLDSFGFDSYSLTSDPTKVIDINAATMMVLPSGDRSHTSPTVH